MEDQSIYAAVGAGLSGVVAGMSALVISQNAQAKNEKQQKYDKIKARKEQYMENKRDEEWKK